MKNKDLIAVLQKLSPEAEVITTSDNFELNNSKVPISFVHEYKTGSSSVRKFTDAFDREKYSKEVWSIMGGIKPVIMIS